MTGGAQVALKYQACLIGPQVIFAGSGPLLYLVAWQYASRGAQVLAVLDAAPPGARYRALPSMLARPAVLAKGAYYLARLRLMGVPIHHGVSLLGAEGEGLRQNVAAHCDALARLPISPKIESLNVSNAAAIALYAAAQEGAGS